MIDGMLGRVVVVGASLAGLRAAESLRSGGHAGPITVIGAELHPPYDRPPLSKRLLAGEWEPDRIALRKPDDLRSLDVEWRLGTSATALDLGRREIVLSEGDPVTFDAAILATGARPRVLPGTEHLPDVVVLRSLDDALWLRSRIAAGGQRVVVVGAGFIGLEVAATARQLGNDVVVLERDQAPLIRVLGAELGHALAAVHADHGVEVRCGVNIESVEAGAVITDTERVPADVVVVGIGVTPSVEWLVGSGLQIGDGLVCRPDLNAGAPLVYAAGDIVRWHNPLFDEEMRVEHWTNAAEQGALAAANLLAEALGEPTQPYAAVPFFWSDQYDRRIQFLGRAGADDETQIVSGAIADREFVALYGRGGHLRGVLGMNSPRLVMRFRKLLLARATWHEALAQLAG
jgi:NADPH-dependent 2,4-dienoyl-CoA reductase/sulfur reductase-like enzyme